MSTPTPAKYGSSGSAQSAFSWTFPGAPIRIDIPLDLIARLQAELNQHESLANTPGAEVGGVLLGHQETPTTLEIDDYLWVSSEERMGSQYHLDASELERLRSVYTAGDENSGTQSQVVGYFRKQSEDHLRLRDEEIGFVGNHFRDPTNVVLLIRTSLQPYTAGFCFWMKAGAFAPFSFRTFPLDAELLRVEATPRSLGTRVTQPAQEAEATLALPARANTAIARLVESASTSSGRSISALDEQAEKTPLLTDATSKKVPFHVPQRMLVAAGLVLVALPLAGLFAFLLRDHSSSAPTRKAPVTAALFPLQLDVESQGDGVNVRWNPQSNLVTQAREGRLVIRETDQQPQIIPLNPQQLTSGHVHYRSSAERVQFQLEIVDSTGNVSKESVLALSSKPPQSVTPALRSHRESEQRASLGARHLDLSKSAPDPNPTRRQGTLPGTIGPPKRLGVPGLAAISESSASLAHPQVTLRAPPLQEPAPSAGVRLPTPPSPERPPNETKTGASLPAPPYVPPVNIPQVKPAPPVATGSALTGNVEVSNQRRIQEEVVQGAATVISTRFAGSWTYPTNGYYHGALPQIVELYVREENGRLSGSVMARFKPSQNRGEQSLRFVFEGALRDGHNQLFNLQTSDGAKGTIELIPGNTPNMLEMTFQTEPQGGKAQLGNMILVKRSP